MSKSFWSYKRQELKKMINIKAKLKYCLFTGSHLFRDELLILYITLQILLYIDGYSLKYFLGKHV